MSDLRPVRGDARRARHMATVQTELRTAWPVPIGSERRERIEAFRAQPAILAIGAQA